MGKSRQIPKEWRKEQAESAPHRFDPSFRPSHLETYYDWCRRNTTLHVDICQSILATNVAELIADRFPSNVPLEGVMIDANDLLDGVGTNCRPPFHLSFVQWETRADAYPTGLPGWMGATVVAMPYSEDPDSAWLLEIAPSVLCLHEDAGWLFDPVPAAAYVRIDCWGRYISMDWQGAIGYENQPVTDFDKSLCHFAAGVVLFTFSLLNCRNTQLIDTTISNTIQRKYERRYGQSLTSYKVLKVTPMRKFRDMENAPTPTDDANRLPRSLHIVRGHFADYRNGNGLFGKYKDIFWVDAHVRGDEKRGVIVKDYDVVPE